MSDFVSGWCPSIPASMQSTWRMNVAKFGDGYEQRMLDGINAKDQTWSVEYASRESIDIMAMDAYLTSAKSRTFPFKDPATGIVYQVFCDAWDINWNIVQFLTDGSRRVFGTLSVEFRKANGVGAG